MSAPKKQRMLDVERTERGPRSSSRELVPSTRGVCTVCGDTVTESFIEQAALVRHGGYGETRRTVFSFCATCGVERQVRVESVRPISSRETGHE